MRVLGRHGQYDLEDEPFAKGGIGTLYASTHANLIYKEYKNELRDPAQLNQLDRVYGIGREVLVLHRQDPGSAPESSVNWPVDLIDNPSGSAIKGVILPSIPARFYLQSGKPRTLDFLLLARANPPRARVRVAILIRLAEIFAWLHSRELVHGDLSAKNVVWCQQPEPGAYLIDADGLQPQQPPPTVGVATPGWTDPRLVEGGIAAHDHHSDWYALALAMYRGLFLNIGNLDRRADRTWPPPKGLPKDLDSRVRHLVERTLEAPLQVARRGSPGEWVQALHGAYVAGGRFDLRALAVLDEHADRYAATNAPPATRPPIVPAPVVVLSPGPRRQAPAQRWVPLPASPGGGQPVPQIPRPAAQTPGYSPVRAAGAPVGTTTKMITACVVVLLVVLLSIRLSTGSHGSESGGGPTPTNESAPGTGSSGVTSPTSGSTVPAPGDGEQSTGTWIAQLASVPYSDGTPKLHQIRARIERQAPGSLVLRSDDFASLRPGYWVVYHPGPFSGGLEVLDFCDRHGRSSKDQCLGRFLSHSRADFKQMCYRKPDGTPTDACST